MLQLAERRAEAFSQQFREEAAQRLVSRPQGHRSDAGIACPRFERPGRALSGNSVFRQASHVSLWPQPRPAYRLSVDDRHGRSRSPDDPGRPEPEGLATLRGARAQEHVRPARSGPRTSSPAQRGRGPSEGWWRGAAAAATSGRFDLRQPTEIREAAAPSTVLRTVPLPRFTGEDVRGIDPDARPKTSAPSPGTCRCGRRGWRRGRGV